VPSQSHGGKLAEEEGDQSGEEQQKAVEKITLHFLIMTFNANGQKTKKQIKNMMLVSKSKYIFLTFARKKNS
jgi:hypothetical protein